MTTSAPRARIVDALSGKRAPTKFFQALSEADEHIALAAECERLQEELKQRHATVDYLSKAHTAAQEEGEFLAREVERARDESDDLRIRNDELWQTVCDQSAELNALRAQLDRARAERDTLVAVSK